LKSSFIHQSAQGPHQSGGTHELSQDGFLVHGQVVPKVVLVFLEDGPVFYLEEKVFCSALVLDDLLISLVHSFRKIPGEHHKQFEHIFF
jgi:hypothetical protein